MTDDVNSGRRRLLTTVTTGVGLAGATALAVPLVASMKPSARAVAAGAPVEVDIEDLEPGKMKVVEWRGKPVWILRRDEQTLADLEEIVGDLSDPDSEVIEQQPAYAQNRHRSIRPDVLVVLGVCTHLGCVPNRTESGWSCPCHGSIYDNSGRVLRGPAPKNLIVPPYEFINEKKIIIGKA